MATASPFFNHTAESARQSGERLLAELQRSQDDISAAKLINMTGLGVDYSVTSERGETPLLLAAQKGFYPAAAKMVSDGADVNAADQFGFTPLMMAASGGDAALTDKLLEKGADMYARSAAGDSALSMTVDQGQEWMLKHLLGKGLVFSDAEGLKAKDSARAKGFDGIAKILEDVLQQRAAAVVQAQADAVAQHARETAAISSQFTQGTGAKIPAPATARFRR